LCPDDRLDHRGEDVVQDAHFRGYRSLDTYDDSRPLAPWLFRIAHNHCIDFLRRRGVRVEAETAAADPDFVAPHELSGARVGPAIEHLVLNLASEGAGMCTPEGCLRLFARGDRGARRFDGRRRESGPQPGPIETGVSERTIRSAARVNTSESRDPSPVRRTVQSPGLGWTRRTDQRRRSFARCRRGGMPWSRRHKKYESPQSTPVAAEQLHTSGLSPTERCATSAEARVMAKPA
jgi:hypothetical protein